MQNKALASWWTFLRVYFTAEMILLKCIEKETVLNKLTFKTSLTISKSLHLKMIVFVVCASAILVIRDSSESNPHFYIVTRAGESQMLSPFQRQMKPQFELGRFLAIRSLCAKKCCKRYAEQQRHQLVSLNSHVSIWSPLWLSPAHVTI